MAGLAAKSLKLIDVTGENYDKVPNESRNLLKKEME